MKNANNPDLIFYAAFLFVTGVIIVRLFITFWGFSGNKQQKSGIDKRNKSAPNRRKVFELLKLESFYIRNPKNINSDVELFIEGVVFFLFRGRSSRWLFWLIVSIIIYSIVEMALSKNYVLPIAIAALFVSVMGILYAITVVFQLIVYIYFFLMKKDFRLLMKGLGLSMTKDVSAKTELFQKAVEAYPSEYGYSKLGESTKWLIIKEEALPNGSTIECDYTASIDYYHKASLLDSNAIEPIKERIDLKRKMRDYPGALDDYHLIKEIEKGKKRKSHYTSDQDFAKILNEWATDLIVIGENDLALAKIDEGLKVLENSSESNLSNPLWELYLNRAIIYFKRTEYEVAIADMYKAIESLIIYCGEFLKDERNYDHYSNEKKDRKTIAIDRLRFEISKQLEKVYLLFKAKEDIQGAIDFLQYFLDKDDKVGNPIFTEHLIARLIDNGDENEAIRSYDKYLNEGHEEIRWFKNWLADRYGSLDDILKKYEHNKMPYKLFLISRDLIDRKQFGIAEQQLNQLFGQVTIPDGVFYLMGKIKEAEWKYSEAINFYRKWFNTQEGDYSDERIIGRIKKEQRKFEEAYDCYNSIVVQNDEPSQEPTPDDVINLAEILEELGEYDKALDLLVSYSLQDRYKSYYSELHKKKVIKERMLHYSDF